MNNPDKEKAIITPAVMQEYGRNNGDTIPAFVPKRIIFTYDPDGAKHLLLLSHGRGRHYPQYGLNYLDGQKGVYLCPLGPTAASMAMEDLIELGARTFINIGTAGGLQNDMQNGDIVLCTAAIGDDGVSCKYPGSDRVLETSKILTGRFKNRLNLAGIKCREGITWTTSTIYRETDNEVKKYRDQEALTVELETAALLAVAKYKRVHLTSVLVVADLLTEGKWRPEYHAEQVQKNLKAILETAYLIL